MWAAPMDQNLAGSSDTSWVVLMAAPLAVQKDNKLVGQRVCRMAEKLAHYSVYLKAVN